MRDSSYQPYFPREYFNVLWKVKVLWKVNSPFKNGPLKSQFNQRHCPNFFTLFIYFPSSLWCLGFPGGSDSTESSHNAGDLGLIPGLGRSPGDLEGGMATHSSILAWRVPINRCVSYVSCIGRRSLQSKS